jgi:hypothetical protein
MRPSIERPPLLKVHYRPIEAAIRWSGVLEHEHQILSALGTRTLPAQDEFPTWPTLRLNTERIYDGIINQELPWAVDGRAAHGEPRIERVDLTVRHIDLRTWMLRYYPEQRPAFLFADVERRTDQETTAAMDVLQLLLLERDSLRTKVDHRERERADLRLKSHAPPREQIVPSHAQQQSNQTMSARAETTYLHIIGAMLEVMLGHAPSGQPYSRFKTQESIVSVMLAQHGRRLGISERTLHAKFAAAKRQLSSD